MPLSPLLLSRGLPACSDPGGDVGANRRIPPIMRGVDEQTRWLRAAADILNAPQAGLAHDLFADELMRQTHADLVTRVGLSPETPERISISVAARSELPPRESWPVAAQARAHPLGQYYATTTDTSPVRLTDLIADGWELSGEHQKSMAALSITRHQMALPCAPRGDFDGWIVLNEDGFTDDDLGALTRLQSLLVGLDRHLAVLAQRERAATGSPDADPTSTLTPREQVVLALVAAGSTAQGIGARLAISPRTVHKHQENLYRKLGASDRLSAVLRAQSMGLLPAAGSDEGRIAREVGAALPSR